MRRALVDGQMLLLPVPQHQQLLGLLKHISFLSRWVLFSLLYLNESGPQVRQLLSNFWNKLQRLITARKGSCLLAEPRLDAYLTAVRWTKCSKAQV